MPAVPSLDSRGWIDNPAEMAELLFAYFLVSNKSQSTTHYSRIASLPYILQTTGNDFTVLKNEVERVLQELYSKYFEKAVISISMEPADGKTLELAQYNMKVSAILTQNGIQYSLGQLLSIANKVVTKVASYSSTA